MVAAREHIEEQISRLLFSPDPCQSVDIPKCADQKSGGRNPKIISDIIAHNKTVMQKPLFNHGESTEENRISRIKKAEFRQKKHRGIDKFRIQHAGEPALAGYCAREYCPP